MCARARVRPSNGRALSIAALRGDLQRQRRRRRPHRRGPWRLRLSRQVEGGRDQRVHRRCRALRQTPRRGPAFVVGACPSYRRLRARVPRCGWKVVWGRSRGQVFAQISFPERRLSLCSEFLSEIHTRIHTYTCIHIICGTQHMTPAFAVVWLVRGRSKKNTHFLILFSSHTCHTNNLISYFLTPRLLQYCTNAGPQVSAFRALSFASASFALREATSSTSESTPASRATFNP